MATPNWTIDEELPGDTVILWQTGREMVAIVFATEGKTALENARQILAAVGAEVAK